jgi:solute carrier family 25 carnitine/acylcarnitine transporter 20/29
LRPIIQKEGYLAIVKGIPAPILGAMAENAIFFSAHAWACRRLFNLKVRGGVGDERVHPLLSGLAGSIAGLATAPFLVPGEYLKCQMQAKHTANKYDNTWKLMTSTYRQPNGIRQLFTGGVATHCREAVGGFGFFALYSASGNWLAPEGGELGTMSLITQGACSGLGYWASMYPIDIVKSRIQTGVSPAGSSLLAIGSTLRDIIRHEGGLRGLYNGFAVVLPRAILTSITIVVSYEYARRFLEPILC